MVVMVLALLVSVLLPSTSKAQGSHAASEAAIEQALQQHVAATEAERDRVLNLLRRSDVRRLAEDVGLDLRRAESAVSTLEGQELTELAAQAQQVESALAGGQSNVTISTTMLIIGLLVVIVLILALK